MTNCLQRAREEVEFWELFIEWWKENRSEGVSVRALDALMMAKLNVKVRDLEGIAAVENQNDNGSICH